jgi:multiple sugar transport system ATP-binding protein
MASVALEQVEKVYPGGFAAIKGLDLEVSDGEFMVLVGPSGCGKTTALRLVAGLEDATGGHIKIADRVVNRVEPKNRDIAMVFQNYALYPNLTVRENIAFALRLRRMAKEERERRVNEAADLLGLTDWIDRKPGQLSGGQRQRVAMGRALVREPAVFLMDEPLSNLDAKLRVQMRAEITRIQRQLGVATLYVTHDQVEAMTMGDKVAVMSKGELQQCGTPQAVYDHPRNLFVAGFMGSPPMNLFETEIGEGAQSMRVGSQQIAIAPEVRRAVPALAGYAGRTVVLGTRPEDLAMVGEAEPGMTLVGTAELVEALGAEQLLHFTTDAQSVEVQGAQDADAEGLSHGRIRRDGAGVARIEARVPVHEGERIRFRLVPDRLRFFDPATTEAIESTEATDAGGH